MSDSLGLETNWINPRGHGRTDIAETLSKVDKMLEDPINLVTRADRFFFNERGLRRIQPLDETISEVAHLMEQGIYWDYVLERRLFTIPTTEFVIGVGELMKNLGSVSSLEVGAGDGSLSLYLKHTGLVGNHHAVDDWAYGGRFSPEGRKPRFVTSKLIEILRAPRNILRAKKFRGYTPQPTPAVLSNRAASRTIENMNLKKALAKYNPDTALAVFFVSPHYGGEDDVEILRHSSVKHLIWVGDEKLSRTSSDLLWQEPGWNKQPLPGLERLIFTQNDGIEGFDDMWGTVVPKSIAFASGLTPDQIRQQMESEKIQACKVVLFTKK